MKNLKALRERAGLTEGELARKASQLREQIKRYEAGANLPRIDKAIAIADVLGVSLDLLTGRVPLPEPAGDQANENNEVAS